MFGKQNKVMGMGVFKPLQGGDKVLNVLYHPNFELNTIES
ncbi:hypothetical protein DB44_EW00090 [Candidatus Protochlamydia amoebophila]|uniref:Uncharacterized protein n=1 Tax=Candidatus Protochlamydia amoebophila TaxID=362787 RepID=A0A0C1JUT5_9BACT|nr:hypothetical protein DB44_EW00090 [Candidatus Protochlamydia amoebophila]